jgi:hypothetical protein
MRRIIGRIRLLILKWRTRMGLNRIKEMVIKEMVIKEMVIKEMVIKEIVIKEIVIEDSRVLDRAIRMKKIMVEYRVLDGEIVV